jgi:hypothetical protein
MVRDKSGLVWSGSRYIVEFGLERVVSQSCNVNNSSQLDCDRIGRFTVELAISEHVQNQSS